MTKKNEEIMEIFEAFDLTRCAWSAAELSGADAKTVQRYVGLRDAGRDPLEHARRARLIDSFVEKIEELVEESKGKVRADVVHDRLRVMGYEGNERTTRRAVHKAKLAYRNGSRRTYRPWIPEPGKWLQFDWGWGPVVHMRQTYLFCAWLAWSRYRLIIPTWDKTLGTVLVCLDRTLRRIGAVPTYALTDNERTVSMDRIAGISVRHPEVVAFGRHYGLRIVTCVPADPESKGGSESTVRVAKADLVPTECNLLPAYDTFPSLVEACDKLADELNGREHRESRRIPAEALQEELMLMHRLPLEPYTAALGETRRVEENQTIRFGSVRYSLPKLWVDQEVWCRVEGEELVIVGRDESGLREIYRHELSVPGKPRILDEHYPGHPNGRGTLQPKPRAQSETERNFLALGEGAEIWLTTAAASGVTRIRAKMSRASELALLLGTARVNEALHRAAHAGRFGENDLASILGHVDASHEPPVVADERFSAQRGTKAWEVLGR
ncbi:MAG TPA: IS21 family transposase [Candidatus Limnocylindrales bacterium]|nr:IS21 family transposase [Candidatus Limnocylindrales bacterium]